MEKQLKIEIRDKVATLISQNFNLVGGNSDYEVVFDFDEDWASYTAKTAVFVYGKGKPIYKVFDGNVCKGIAIENATMCFIGVFAGDIVTTTPACVECVRCSILDLANGTPEEPTNDVYNQIMELLNRYINAVKGAPSGGKAGQVLKKDSDQDYDYSWQDDEMRDPTEVLQTTGNSETAVMSQKAVTNEINKLDKRLANVEASISDDMFITDSTVEYEKVVPENVAPYAEINKIGGMTYKSKNLFNPADIKVMDDGSDYGITFTIDEDGTMHVKGTVSIDDYWAVSLQVPFALVGNYCVTFYGNGASYCNIAGAPELDLIPSEGYGYPFTSDGTRSLYIDFYQTNAEVITDIDLTCKIMINEGNTSLPWEPYSERFCNTPVTKLKSMGDDLLDTFEIPEAIQALPGYGEGASENCNNFIVYNEDGTVKYVKNMYDFVYNKANGFPEKSLISSQTNSYRYYINTPKHGALSNRRIVSNTHNQNLGLSVCDKLNYTSYYTDAVGYYLDSGSVAIYIKSPYATAEETANWLDGTVFKLPLAKPEVIDITHLMPSDNFLKVEGNGRIRAVNEHEQAAPTTITYQKEG